MTEQNRSVIPRQTDPGFFGGLTNQIRLVLRLMGDKRVNFLLKLLPVGSLAYLVFPTDLLILNPVDDAVIIGVGLYAFVELCPPDVVAEHRAALSAGSPPPGEVVDAEYKDSSKG